MKELIEALHTAARRYCREQSRRHGDVHARLEASQQGFNRESQRYSNKALDTFPRWQILDAIQHAVERLVPGEFDTLEQARARFIDAGDTAQSPHSGAIEQRAIAEERARFAEYLRSLDEEALWRVQPLPSRRVLSAEEVAALEARRRERFGLWYGGAPDRGELPEHVTLIASALAGRSFAPAMRALVRPLATRLWELRESGPSFEIDLELASFAYSDEHGNWGEAYWFSDALDWMVNASHEDTLTVMGPSLVASVRRDQPEWLRQRAG